MEFMDRADMARTQSTQSRESAKLGRMDIASSQSTFSFLKLRAFGEMDLQYAIDLRPACRAGTTFALL